MSVNAPVEADEAQINSCIARLWDGAPARTDFRDFVETLEAWGERADEEGLRGTGEAGSLARGVALAYREILKRIKDAVNPVEGFAQKPQEQVG